MKKVILILPDKIVQVSGSSRSYYKREINLTEQDLIKVLCEDDYHTRYKFYEEDITIVAIEDYRGE